MEFVTKFLLEVLTVYIITCVITSSSLFEYPRKHFMELTPMLKFQEHKHFIECRLCVSFWVSLIVSISIGELLYVFPLYGAAYFLATQER